MNLFSNFLIIVIINDKFIGSIPMNFYHILTKDYIYYKIPYRHVVKDNDNNPVESYLCKILPHYHGSNLDDMDKTKLHKDFLDKLIELRENKFKNLEM